jgi:hypothetical protein
VRRAQAGDIIGPMATDVRDYIDAIPDEYRPLFDRIHRLTMQAAPHAVTSLAYGMPAFSAGRRRLSVGVWKHGVSIYGWDKERDGGFVARHPDLRTSTGTLRIRPADAEAITDDEFLALLGPALA